VFDPLFERSYRVEHIRFQLASGIHASILMSESVDGLSVAATRQNAGSCLKAAVGCTPPRPGAGDENAPAATDCVSAIVVLATTAPGGFRRSLRAIRTR